MKKIGIFQLDYNNKQLSKLINYKNNSKILKKLRNNNKIMRSIGQINLFI